MDSLGSGHGENGGDSTTAKKKDVLQEEEIKSNPTQHFAFLNVSNPSVPLSAENRQKVRQHVRYKVSDQTKSLRQPQKEQDQLSSNSEAVLEAGDSPFVNVTHPNQIKDSGLLKFVRTQSHRKYKKESRTRNKKPKSNSISQIGSAGKDASKDGEGVILQLPSPARLHVSQSSSIYPIKMNPDIHTAIAFLFSQNAKNEGTRLKIPHGHGLFLLDQDAFMKWLGPSTINLGKAQGIDRSRQALELQQTALRSVQRRLADPVESKSDGIAIAVASFIAISSATGDKDGYRIHVEGLARLMGLRGGIDTYNHIPGFRILLLWIEVICSFGWGCPPRFPPPLHTIPLPEPTPVSRTLGKLLDKCTQLYTSRPSPSSSSSSEEDTLFHLMDLYNFNNQFRQRLRLPKNDTTIWNQSLQHNAIALGFMSASAPSSVWAPGSSVEKCCRLASIIYLDEMRHVTGEVLMKRDYHFVEKLASVAHIVDPAWENAFELRLWVLVIGGCFAERNPERGIFVATTLEVMEVLNVSRWTDVVGVVRGIVWLDEVLQARCQQFGLHVMAQA